MPLERRDRTITHIVVQIANRTRDDPVQLLPRSTLLERRLDGPTQKQTVEDPLRLLVEKKVAVKVQVIGQQRSPYQFDHPRGLLALRKGRIGSPQTLQTLKQPLLDLQPGRHSRINRTVPAIERRQIKPVQGREELQIALARREVQIPQNLIQILNTLRLHKQRLGSICPRCAFVWFFPIWRLTTHRSPRALRPGFSVFTPSFWSVGPMPSNVSPRGNSRKWFFRSCQR